MARALAALVSVATRPAAARRQHPERRGWLRRLPRDPTRRGGPTCPCSQANSRRSGTRRAELASDHRRPPAHADSKHCGCLLLTRDYIVLHGAHAPACM